MPLQERLRADLRGALRAGDKPRVLVLRLILSALGYAEIDKGQPLDGSGILGIIAKEASRHRESIEAFRKGNRPDLVAQEEAELSVIQEYLPQPVTREEIAVAARLVIAEVRARGLQDKGKVMPHLIAQLKGRAEGKEINAVVSELLAQSAAGSE